MIKRRDFLNTNSARVQVAAIPALLLLSLLHLLALRAGSIPRFQFGHFQFGHFQLSQLLQRRPYSQVRRSAQAHNQNGIPLSRPKQQEGQKEQRGADHV